MYIKQFIASAAVHIIRKMKPNVEKRQFVVI